MVKSYLNLNLKFHDYSSVLTAFDLATEWLSNILSTRCTSRLEKITTQQNESVLCRRHVAIRSLLHECTETVQRPSYIYIDNHRRILINGICTDVYR